MKLKQLLSLIAVVPALLAPVAVSAAETNIKLDHAAVDVSDVVSL